VTATLPLQRLVEVDAEIDDAAVDWWPRERGAVRAALRAHYGTDHRGDELPESPDPTALRAALRTAAPGLAAITDRIRAEFDSGACAVVVRRLGVVPTEPDIDEQRRALFALAALQGPVMANHPDPAVVWDVRNRTTDPAVRMRASSSDREAQYHTDAGYLAIPPRYFLLFASQAADCGGGVSLLRDGRELLEQLSETEEGAEALRVLRETVVPRLVSESLWPWASVGADGFQQSHLLGELPMWRWTVGRTRRYASEEAAAAITTVRRFLRRGPGEVRYNLPTDGVLMIDNHIALHARTAFTDQRRNLFRIRWHDPAHRPGR
jgi:alpha-ketoglutarate-dependent taurine dioxygenase